MASRIARTLPLAAFVLHRYDWSESSLILDLFTREQGRIAVAAKGAKRPYLAAARACCCRSSASRCTLGRARRGDDGARGPHAARRRMGRRRGDAAPARRCFSGFYLNELLMKLLARARSAPGAVRCLRRHARRARRCRRGARRRRRCAPSSSCCCSEIGLLPDLGIETATRRPVRAGRALPRAAPTPASSPPPGATDATASGATLCDGAGGARRRRHRRAAARRRAARWPSCGRLLRAQLHYHLGAASLRTRQVMIDAQALTQPRPDPRDESPGRRPSRDRARRRHGALGQRQQDRAAAQPAATCGIPSVRRRCRASRSRPARTASPCTRGPTSATSARTTCSSSRRC